MTKESSNRKKLTLKGRNQLKLICDSNENEQLN